MSDGMVTFLMLLTMGGVFLVMGLIYCLFYFLVYKVVVKVGVKAAKYVKNDVEREWNK